MFATRLICSWIGTFGLAAGAFGQTYVEIIASFAGSSYTFPYSINEAGVIAGSWSLNDGLGPVSGFERDAAGTITTFRVPGLSTDARSINAAGAITGSYSIPCSSGTLATHGFVRDPFGNFTSFDADRDPCAVTYPRSITAGGAVTGYYSSSPTSSVNHGFLREDNGTITSFDPPGSTSTTALSINPAGAITGNYQRANGRVHGFLRHPTGDITSFDPPGSTGTFPAGINYSGAITGVYTTADGRNHGFVRDAAGKITSFDFPGSTGTSALSINNNGVITGNYVDNAGTHGFVRAPGGSFTSFDPPSICQRPFGSQAPPIPTGINDDGVITGWCNRTPISSFVIVGWARFP
jgi:YD repeat-containing protein